MKIIYAISHQSVLMEKDLKSNHERNLLTLARHSNLSLFKYTPDGKFIVAFIIDYNTNGNDMFHVIESISGKCRMKINLNPKTICKYSEKKFFELKNENNVFFCIKTFSISQSNSKIAFILQLEDSTYARARKIIMSEIYVIDLREESFIPKQVYQADKYLTSLNWLPNGKSIIFTEEFYKAENHNPSLNMKILNIDSDSYEKIEVSVLKDKEDKIIEGQVLGWIENKSEL